MYTSIFLHQNQQRRPGLFRRVVNRIRGAAGRVRGAVGNVVRGATGAFRGMGGTGA